MDEFEAQVLRENQSEMRRRVLAHLQAALREVRGYQVLKLQLAGDMVTIIYDGGSQQQVNIECDSELAMILDVVKKVMY